MSAPPDPHSSSSSSTTTATARLPFRASSIPDTDSTTRHLLLACTGSVATIKLPQILSSLSRYNISVRVLLSSSAARFLQGQSDEQPHFQSLLGHSHVADIYTDADEWAVPWTRGAPILHIELRRWADILVVAPLSANALAGMVHGRAEGLVLEVLRCWDTSGVIDPVRWQEEDGAGGEKEVEVGVVNEHQTPDSRRRRRKRVVVAPAMNTAMWRHPVTAKQIAVLEDEWGVDRQDGEGWVEVLRPQEKALACGDVGDGAMRSWEEIVEVIVARLALTKLKS